MFWDMNQRLNELIKDVAKKRFQVLRVKKYFLDHIIKKITLCVMTVLIFPRRGFVTHVWLILKRLHPKVSTPELF